MPAPLDSDAPNVDARYVQNLTINITYHTSAGMLRTLCILRSFVYLSIWLSLPVPTYSAPMPQYYLFHGTFVLNKY
jgi:hypothetical protein